MIEKHQIVVDKELYTYTYMISHYKKEDINASCCPETDIKDLTREEFLELAYHKEIEIFVVESKENHPFFSGATMQKLREPNPFETL